MFIKIIQNKFPSVPCWEMNLIIQIKIWGGGFLRYYLSINVLVYKHTH